MWVEYVGFEIVNMYGENYEIGYKPSTMGKRNRELYIN